MPPPPPPMCASILPMLLCLMLDDFEFHYSMVSGHTETISDLQWNPSGSNLVSVDNNGVFKLWAMKVINAFNTN